MSNRPNTAANRPDRAGATGSGNGSRFVVYGLIAVVALAGLAAIGLSVALGDDDAEVVDASGEVVDAVETGEVLVFGDPLAMMPDGGDDPAVGQAAPELEGFSHTGEPVAVPFDGRPKLVLFLAHWCPHCQDELPEVVEWVEAGGLPEGVDVYLVASGQDDGAPNWPPSAWFAREGVDVTVTPTLMDSPEQDAARAYGLAGYPYLVVLDDQHEVLGRFSGRIGLALGTTTPDALDTLAQLAAAS